MAPPPFSLRPYQALGVEFITSRTKLVRGRILADPPGFGKGIQGVAALKAWVERGSQVAGTVVCPAGARGDWRRAAAMVWPSALPHVVGDAGEAARATERPLVKRLREATGPANASLRETLNAELRALRLQAIADAYKNPASIVVVSYESAEMVLEAAPQLLGMVILDEAHSFKNTAAFRTKVVRPLVGRAEIAALLTGTPISNRPMDLHNLLDLCHPGKFGSRNMFAHRYFTMEATRGGWGYRVGRLVDKVGLAKAVAPYLLARTVKDAYGELPPRVYKLVQVETARTKMLKLRAPANKKESNEMLRRDAKTQLDRAVELAVELDEPCVVYTYAKADAQKIQQQLEKRGRTCALAMGVGAEGGSTPKKRDKILQAWKAGEQQYLVCTMDAVTTSATLTRAAAMIFADLDHNPSKMVQCMGRTDPSRQPEGERRPSRYYFVVGKNSYAEVVAQRCIEKIRDAQGVVSHDAAAESLLNCLSPTQPESESDDDAIADLVARVVAHEERMRRLDE